MGQKVNPHGLRVGVIKDWDSRWYAREDKVGDLIVEDYKIREYLKKTLYSAGVPTIEIERDSAKVRIYIHCSRPGVVIGKGGAEIERLRLEVEKLIGKPVALSIVEVRTPDTNAQLVAENIAQQLEKRIGFRRAMKNAMGRAIRMGARGIKVKCGSGIASVEVQEDGRVKSTLANGEELFSDEVLVAIGRTLNTRGMGLEEVGVKMEKNGQIDTDEHMRTSVPNIFAAGDITVGTQLSDKAQRQGLVIAETIAGGDYYINYDAIPATMFMEPEIAMVGLTVSDAAERGIETISGSLPFSSNEKAMAIGKTEGLIKVVARKDDHVIIGAQIFGHEACDLIAEMTVAVENGLTLEQVYNSIHPHPTLTEIILEVCKRAVGLSFDKA